MRVHLVAFAAVIASASPALAANGICRSFNIQNDVSALGLYEISDPGRTRFIKGSTSETGNCPSLEPACRQPSFLIEGDKVVVNEIEGDFACANYVNAKGVNLANWLPLASLSLVEVQPKWEGRWTNWNGSAFITITAGDRNQMLLTGSAHAEVDTGEFVTQADSTAPEIRFVSDSGNASRQQPGQAGNGRHCVVHMRQMGPYIASMSSGPCSRRNAIFNGLFRKR